MKTIVDVTLLLIALGIYSYSQNIKIDSKQFSV